MLNLNSPTVQAMLGNTPQGYGNMPVYYGNSPTVTQTEQPSNGFQTPFPSPKEMIAQGGQQMIYNPTSFAPRNIVGAYNPGYNAAFAGYSNPYMGYGYYGGYGNSIEPIPDEDSRDRLEAANFNGISYSEQLAEESKLYKTISRIVSKNIGRSEDKAKECEEAFNIFNKYPKKNNSIELKSIVKPMHIKLKIGDEVIADMNPENVHIKQHDYTINCTVVEGMKRMSEVREYSRISRCNTLYDLAVERRFDNVDLLDFFNNCAGTLMTDSLIRKCNDQLLKRTSQTYDSERFKKQLFTNNNIRSRDQLNAIERFAGRYGIMPDGRPVSPGHDPEIASSFSYNAKTGQYEVTAPNIIRDRLERARQSFIQSIEG